MGQTGWRLPDDLLKRVRVHCAQTGERQNEFVRQALEKALAVQGHVTGAAETPAPPRTSEGIWTQAEVAASFASQKAPRLGKGFVPPRPKGT